MITVSPMRTSLRRISSSLCSVALVTVTPPTKTGSSCATGVSLPGAADLDLDAESAASPLPAPGTCAPPQSGCARDVSELLAVRRAIDLVDDAVDFVRQALTRRSPTAREMQTTGDTLTTSRSRGYRHAEIAEPVQQRRVVAGSATPCRLAQPVRKETQRALSRHPRIELPHAPPPRCAD